jgi:nucleotide-binding universal stress UspA family protein
MTAYLDTKVRELEGTGLAVAAEMLTGASVAETLLRREEPGDVDLVAMTTHGRTGIHRAAFGSVADRVLRNGTVPVLLRRVS